jgi:SAM-dependent methyltransferase
VGQVTGIRPQKSYELALKRALRPLQVVFNHLFGSGFICRGVGRLIQKYFEDCGAFLEVGCGSIELRRYLPRGHWYNAIDLAYSEFQLRRALSSEFVNLAMASATDIPLADGSVTVVVATEVFEHIPPIEDAVREIRRIMQARGKLICSIPNNFYHKYQVLGENTDHVNKWTFRGFPEFMSRFGFDLLESRRVGYWVPLSYWLPIARHVNLLRDLYLPITPKAEYYTSNFLYVFELTDKSSQLDIEQ